MVGHRAYDLMYRWWAPWDAVGVRDDLRRLLDGGSGSSPDGPSISTRTRVSTRTHPRTVDLGCGTGANVVELASRGYEATGVDFSRVALDKAHERARRAGVADRCRFVQADLTDPSLPRVLGEPFDLLTDFGTLDDLDAAGRAAMADNIARIARPGATLLFWCFYGRRAELPLFSLAVPSRLFAELVTPGEEEELFGDHFDIEPFSRSARHVACFLLRRREAAVGPRDRPAT